MSSRSWTGRHGSSSLPSCAQLQHLNLATGEVKGYQCRIHREPAIQVTSCSRAQSAS